MVVKVGPLVGLGGGVGEVRRSVGIVPDVIHLGSGVAWVDVGLGTSALGWEL